MKTRSDDQRETTANELVATHLYLVQHVVNQLASRYPRHVDRGELWSAGAHGLVDASRRFDETAGIPFARYASIRIRGAIIDATRSGDWATRSLRRGMRNVRAAGDRFEEEHGRSATATELADLLGITLEQLHERRAAAAAAVLLHLDQSTGDAEEATLADNVEERAADWLPDEAVEQRELIGTLRTAIRFLPPVQREVVERYYFSNEMLREIAESLAVTEARVSQIRSEALAAVRAYLSTTYEGVAAVADDAPGKRQRAAYVASVAAQSTWRSRMSAADEPVAAKASLLAGATRRAS